MWALFMKEIRSFLSSLIGYIVIGVFLLVTGIFLWVDPQGVDNIFNSGKASIGPLFELAPLLFLLLIPAITMRFFAEEKRTGTIELLMTKPLTDYQIVMAKFLAGFVLVIFSLLPTLIYYWCISELKDDLSQIDTGRMWGSYIGLLFIGGAYVAIGTFASSISKNQVVSFVFTAGLCIVMYMGFDELTRAFGMEQSFLMNLGISEHYYSISKGLIDTRDLAYFLSLIVLFLVLTKLTLSTRKW